jgi:cell division protein FtsI (penicillin-binding protein 3)
VVGGRLVQLQAFDGQHYAAVAQQQRLETADIPAERGRILDRDGRVLAYTAAARTVFADPSLVTDPAGTAAALAPLLGQPEAKLAPKLRRSGRYVVLARDVTLADAARIRALKLPEIGTQGATQRLYPGRDSAAAVVGFTGRDGTGLAGIESRYDRVLAGTPGKIVVETGRQGQEIPSGVRRETSAMPGSSVRLTISEDLQYMVQQQLTEQVRLAHAKGGQVVVLDADTGEVLAMASTPTFDAQHVAASNPLHLGNPAVQAVFEPGSANKVVTFSGAVERGLIRPGTPVTVPGSIRVADRIIHDAWSHGVVHYTAAGVLAKSSNVGTLEIAQRLGPEAWYDYVTRFGIGSRTGIELPGESAGLLPTPDTWSGSTFGNLPIGQGLSMTALQLAAMYQTVANDGVRVPPRIVASVIGPDGRVSPEVRPPGVRVISAAAARTVRTMLEAVTQEGGTAPGAAIDGYRTAGKTGTAQKPNPRCRCYSGGGYWATFAGIAPADAPQFVVAVVIDDAKGGGHGGAVAAPLFRTIASYALTQRGVPPSGSPSPKFRLVLDQ